MASSSSSAASASMRVVVRDDGLGEADVGLVERAGRVLDRVGDEGGDLDEAILHLAQLLLEHLAHAVDPLDVRAVAHWRFAPRLPCRGRVNAR